MATANLLSGVPTSFATGLAPTNNPTVANGGTAPVNTTAQVSNMKDAFGNPVASAAQVKTPQNSQQTAFYNALPTYYPNSTVANRTPDQLAAANMVRNTANSQQATLGNYLTNFMNSNVPATTTLPTASPTGPTTNSVNTTAKNINEGNYSSPLINPVNLNRTQAIGPINNVSTAATGTNATSTNSVGTNANLSGAVDFALGDILTQGNPYSQAAMDSATRQITDNFVQSVLPQLGSAAQRAGAWGGSRQGIVEGLAAGETAKAVGDTAANLAARNYETSLNTFNNALGVATNLRGQDLQDRQISSTEGLQNRQLTSNEQLQNRQLSSNEAMANQQTELNRQIQNQEIASNENLAKLQADLQVAVQNRQISSQEAEMQLNAAVQQSLQNRQITSNETLQNRQLTSQEQQQNATRDAERALQNRQLTSAELLANREMDINNKNQIAQLLPSLVQLGYTPAQMLDAVGQDAFNYNQALLDSDVARHNYNQNADAIRLGQYANILSGNSTSGIMTGGSSTSTSNVNTPKTSNLQNALGGAATGAAIGSMTNFENGGTWGAVLGALAGLFS